MASPGSFIGELFGPAFFENRWVRRFMALSPTTRILLFAGGLGALLFLPNLGAVGLWDPWETHYGEVARMMVDRSDYVYPYWENAWFFSKPVLSMWMMALGMQVVGTNRTEGALAPLTEWGMRLPFALLSIVALAMLALAVWRLASRRAGMATAVILATMPLYFLLSRQAVTDTPAVSLLMAAMACAMIGQLDPTTRHRTAWWYGFYVLMGLSVLAKGLLALTLAGATLFMYAVLCVLPWTAQAWMAHLRWLFEPAFRAEVRAGTRPMPTLWGQLYRMRFGTGLLVFLAVAVPWYAVMFSFPDVDDESSSFWKRFVHDHFGRMFQGVHTTTPGGTFIYFIEQAGFALFPWVALVPGAFAVASRLKLRSNDTRAHLGVLAVLWVAFSYFFLGSSATKFHHYVFPILPGLAVLIALFVDELWEDGISAHAVSLVLGLVLFLLVGKDLAQNPKNFTDLFVYNYDRPYPDSLVERPLALVGMRALYSGDLLALALLAFGGYLCAELFFTPVRERRPLARALALAVLLSGGGVLLFLSTHGVTPSLVVGLGLLSVGLFLGYEATRAVDRSEGILLWVSALGLGLLAAALMWVGSGTLGHKGPDPLVAPLTDTLNIKQSLGFFFKLAAGLCVVAALLRARVMLFGAFLSLALGFAVWFNWSHWVDLSHHWTQRDLFKRYYAYRKPDEPIAAFLMNWRGETLYSKNRVKQIRDNARMNQFAAQPGREWVLVEHNRLSILRSAVGPERSVTEMSDATTNNKFVLVTVD